MNAFTQFIQQIKSADYASANQTFGQIMQQKVADRLATERQSIFKENVTDIDETFYSDWECAKCGETYDMVIPKCLKCGSRDFHKVSPKRR